MDKKAAHFLLTPPLWDSPPNDALRRIYEKLGYDMAFFAPLVDDAYTNIDDAQYGIRWILKNIFSLRWRHYDAFSCTTEDPVVIAAMLSLIWRKPLIVLSDEIKSGSYRGNRREYWKRLCRWALGRADLTIVNDESRISLQRDYASLTDNSPITVYPGCFLHPPKPDSRTEIRQKWGVADNDLVLAFSGYCSVENGIDWSLECLEKLPQAKLVLQPLSVKGLSSYLLHNHKSHEQIRIALSRLSWQESWSSMGGADIGISIYRNPAPQFQNMGISSNRLCMFLAMGVPVIVTKQPSFQFIEDYDCGVMVENSEEFLLAVKTISSNLETMKKNALKCADEYIDTASKFVTLESMISSVLHVADS